MRQNGFAQILILIGVVVLGLIGGIYYLGFTKNNAPEQMRQTKPQYNDEKTNNNKIFYVLFHPGTVSPYEQNKNLNLSNNDYSEIYSYDLATKQTSLVFSDQKEEFGMNSPTEANWYVTRVGNSKLFYKAIKRKSDPSGTPKGWFSLDLNTGKSIPYSTLPNVNFVSGDMNGKLIAYTARNADAKDITIKDTTTGVTKQIIDFASKSETDPNLFIKEISLSPDGKHIAVETSNGFPPNIWEELVVVDVVTGKVVKLIKKDQLTSPRKTVWTDNSHLIFVAGKYLGQQYTSGVYTMDIEGKNLQNIYTFEKMRCDAYCDVMLDQTGTVVYEVESIDEADKNKPRDKTVTKSKILRTDLKTGQTETLKEISIPNRDGLSFAPFFIY